MNLATTLFLLLIFAGGELPSDSVTVGIQEGQPGYGIPEQNN